MWRLSGNWTALPGVAPGAPRRNALVLIGYVFATLVVTSTLFGVL